LEEQHSEIAKQNHRILMTLKQKLKSQIKVTLSFLDELDNQTLYKWDEKLFQTISNLEHELKYIKSQINIL